MIISDNIFQHDNHYMMVKNFIQSLSQDAREVEGGRLKIF